MMKNIFGADVELLIVLGRGYIMLRKQDSKTNNKHKHFSWHQIPAAPAAN